MSDSNRVALRYVKEVTFGTNPGTDMTALRYTSEGLTPNVEFIASDEIRNDRQITDTIQTGSEPGGDINFELSYGTFDPFFEAALYSAGWSTAVNVSRTDIDAAAGDNSFNTAAGDFTTENIAVGQWIEVRGFSTNPTNNGYFRVVSITALKLVVDGGPALITEAAGDTITMKGEYIRNGTTRGSFTVEKEFTDITQFEVYNGVIPGTLDLSIESDSIVTGTFTTLGLTHTLQQVTAGTGTVTAANTNDVMNAVSNVLKVVEGGSVLSDCVQSADFTLNDNLRGIKCVGVLGNNDVGVGRVEVTGSMTVYFANNTIYDKFTNVSTSSLSFIIEDGAGNAYAITFPKIKYTALSAVAGGTDQDVVLDLEFQALLDTASGATVQIDRFAA